MNTAIKTITRFGKENMTSSSNEEESRAVGYLLPVGYLLVISIIYLILLIYTIYLIFTEGSKISPVVLAIAIVCLFSEPGPIASLALLLTFKHLRLTGENNIKLPTSAFGY